MARSTKPEYGNKYFNTKASGGYSTCIQGSPTESGLTVLANCVGYASGAYNEAYGAGREVFNLNCNAKNFIERAVSLGLSIYQQPMVGGIMVFGHDVYAGHVAYVYQVVSDTQVKTSESGWNSTAFWTATRNKGNGNWGAGTGYYYRGCIAPKGYTPTPTPTPTPSGKFAIGDKVVLRSGAPLYYSSDASNPVNYADGRVTNITRTNGSKHPYNTTGDYGWMNESDITKYEGPTDRTHTVRPGENLSMIASKYGTTWKKIYDDNRAVIGSNPNIIRPGQILVIK